MCFSAEASFIGAAALTVIGTATFNTVQHKQDKLWASIPLLFAFQQFCEGIVWLDLRGSIPHSALTVLAKDLYLFFALALWLMWIPLAFLIAEPEPIRKKILKFLLTCGIALAFINLSSYPILDLTPSVRRHSISYLNEAILYKKLFYLSIVALPPLISSIKYMRIFGTLIIISCATAEYFYTTTFTSVWCFLGSFISATLFMISRANIKIKEKNDIQNISEKN